MKKYALIVLAVLLLAGGGAAAWWKFGRARDPLILAKTALDKGDTRTAMIELRNAVRDHPENAEAHLRLGVLQMQAGDAVAAEKELKSAREQGSNAAEIPILLAQSYLQQGRAKELLAEFAPPAATPELSSQLLILRAFAQIATQNPGAAQSSLAAAERISPNSPNPPLAAARLAVSRGDLVQGEAKVNQALAHDARRADALLLKAQIQNARGDQQAALATLNEALAISPKYAIAKLERANLLITLNRDAEARPDVDSIIAEQPNYAAAIYLRAVLLARANDDTNADLDFQKLSGVMQRFPRALYFQAIVKYNLGQMEQATDSATRYVQQTPSDAQGVKLLARILLAAGRGDRALAVLQDAVRKGTADAETLDLLGRAYTMTGKPAQAVQTFDRAASLAPANADILTHLASAKVGRADSVDAGRDITRSLQSGPQAAAAVEAPAVAALASGDVDKATRALDALRAQVGNTETVGLLTGALLVMKQDLTGATAQFQELIAANPAQSRARVALARVQLMQNHQDDAERSLAEAVAQDPTSADALAGLLQILLGENRIARAVAVVESAYATTPDSPALMLALSDLYIRAQTPDKALTLLDRAPKSLAQSAPALAARARVEVALDRKPAARATYTDVLKLVPGDSTTIAALVSLETDAKDWDAARLTLSQALSARPGDPALLRLLVGVDLAQGGEPAAFASIARLQAEPANKDGARTLAADLNLYNHHFLEAAEGYAALNKAQPSAPMTLAATNAYMAAGQQGTATATLRGFLETHPDDPNVMRALGFIEFGADHADAAQPLLERALALQPDDPIAMNNLALIYQAKGDPRALPTGRRAFLLLPSPQSADTLGWILVTQGNATDALPLLSQSAGQLRDDPSVQYHYAVALKDTGKPNEALAILRPLAALPRPFTEQPAVRKLADELGAAR